MIDLQRFCDPARRNIAQPWRVGRHVFASNGKLILRVNRESYPSVVGHISPPNLDFLRWNHESIRDWLRIDGTTFPDAKNETCRACNGHGSHSCLSCDHRHECGKCDGRGSKRVPVRIPIGNHEFDSELLRLIATLPKPMVEISTAETGTPIAFEFDGGEGYVMGLAREKKK